MDRRGEVVWGDFVHEERLVEDRAYWQWGDVRGPFRWGCEASLHRESLGISVWEEGMDSRPRLHGGRLFAGKTGGVRGELG